MEKEVIDGSKEIVLEFNLPEFKRKDIEVKILKNSISIAAHLKKEKEVKKGGFSRFEKGERSFTYFSSLPEVDSKKAKIDFNNEKLIVIIPKK